MHGGKADRTAEKLERKRITIVRRFDLPPTVARAFVGAMNEYFAEKDPHKREAIAVRQLSILGQYQNPREGKLRLVDVKAMFEQMRDDLLK